VSEENTANASALGTKNFERSLVMKIWVKRMLVMLFIASMTGVMTFAKGKKETVTLSEDIKVNGTLVKKGAYAVQFDEQTGELVILKGDKAIAKTSTRLENRGAKARGFELLSARIGDANQLVSVSFAGSDKLIVVNQGSGQTMGNQ